MASSDKSVDLRRAVAGGGPWWRSIPVQLAAVEVGANALAGVTTFVFLQYLYPSGHAHSPHAGAVITLAFVIYLACALPVGAAINARLFLPVARWRAADRPPTAREQWATLVQPIRQAAGAFALWLVAAVLFGILLSVEGYAPHRVVESIVGILLGALACCSLSAFAVERVVRPLAAAALADGPPTRPSSVGIRPRMLLAWAFGSGVPIIGVVVLSLDPDVHSVHSLALPVVALCATTLFSGFAMTFVAARSVAEPLERVRRALREISAGDLSVEVPVDDAGEVGQLEAGVNEMVRGLRERRDLEDLLGRFVGVAVAEQALERGNALGGERHNASMLFVDLVGSTQMVGVLSPEEVVRRLNCYFQSVVDVIGLDGGWVNKFEGDGALCVFGPPGGMTSHPSHALHAARALRSALGQLAPLGIDAAIGVSSGEVVAGNIGSRDRFEYTVIGDPVNEAARLTELAKLRPGRILASHAVVNAAQDHDAAPGRAEAARWHPIGRSHLRGRTEATILYEPKPGG